MPTYAVTHAPRRGGGPRQSKRFRRISTGAEEGSLVENPEPPVRELPPLRHRRGSFENFDSPVAGETAAAAASAAVAAKVAAAAGAAAAAAAATDTTNEDDTSAAAGAAVNTVASTVTAAADTTVVDAPSPLALASNGQRNSVSATRHSNKPTSASASGATEKTGTGASSRSRLSISGQRIRHSISIPNLAALAHKGATAAAKQVRKGSVSYRNFGQSMHHMGSDLALRLDLVAQKVASQGIMKYVVPELQFLHNGEHAPLVLSCVSLCIIGWTHLDCFPADYRGSFWYWEIVATVRKLLLTSVLTVTHPGTYDQIAVGIIIVVLFWRIETRAMPYFYHQVLPSHIQVCPLSFVLTPRNCHTLPLPGRYAL